MCVNVLCVTRLSALLAVVLSVAAVRTVGSAAELVDSTRYIVGPGDEFTISFSEARIAPFTTVVGVEGLAAIDGVGTYNLAGLTLSKAKAKLRAGLKTRFSGSGPELRLTTVREKRTLVAGAVVHPGLYSTKATALASDLIAKAGGLTGKASRRNIEIRTEEGPRAKTFPVDLDMFTIAGAQESNPPVYLGDVIYVPLFSDSAQRCYVSGEVRSPRWIEYTGRDNALDLVHLAGGLTGAAREDSVFLFDGSSGSMVALRQTVSLPPGSRLIVLAHVAQARETDVSVNGAVVNPGRYPFREGMTVDSLIARAGGLLSAGYRDGITLFNNSTDNRALVKSLLTQESGAIAKAGALAPVGPSSVDNLRSGGATTLAPGDSVVVPLATGFVSVLGQVRVPGLVSFVPGRSARDYISSVGGTTSWSDISRSYVSRHIAGGATPLSSAGIIYDGDIIFVARKTDKHSSGALGWIRDVTLIGAGVALTVFAIDKAGN